MPTTAHSWEGKKGGDLSHIKQGVLAPESPIATMFLRDLHRPPIGVEQDADRVSGAWLFRGTRVTVSALFENLEDGVSASEFVDLFPGMTLNQVRAVLEHVARSALAPA
jgi:uncharacterized protein (DUF433 family)